LPYLNRDPLDEFVMLAEQLISGASGEGVMEAQGELDRALALIADGKRSEAAPHAFRAYQILYYPA
jgi:hypothetical protein